MSGGSVFRASGIVVLFVDSLDDSKEIAGDEVDGRGGLIVVGSSSEFRARVSAFNLRVDSRSGAISSDDLDICSSVEDGCAVEG